MPGCKEIEENFALLLRLAAFAVFETQSNSLTPGHAFDHFVGVALMIVYQNDVLSQFVYLFFTRFNFALQTAKLLRFVRAILYLRSIARSVQIGFVRII